MCTRLQINVKSVSPVGIKRGFLPCGKCAECRALVRDNWTTRLRLSVNALRDTHYFTFCTLTYDDEHLPHIPHCLIRDGVDYGRETPMCFSKEHCRKFIKNLREWLRYRGELSPVYLLASEFGEHTQRCHYHFFLAVPKIIDSHEVFEQINNLWGENGFVFPRYHDGGVDSHGYRHLPFVVESPDNAAAYCAKYCCKDIKYYESFDLGDFRKKFTLEDDEWKLSDYLQFHMQSKQLGLVCLKNVSSEDKLKLLNDGVQFVGDTLLHRLPRYIENKLLFHNYYIKENGKRLVRRLPTVWFEENKDVVFENKLKKVEENVKKWMDMSYWFDLSVDKSSDELLRIRNVLGLLTQKYGADARFAALDYLLYFGRDFDYCFVPRSDSDVVDVWFDRYRVCLKNYDWLGFQRMSEDDFFAINYIFSCVHELENDLNEQIIINKLKTQRKQDKIKDYYKSKEY